MQKLDRRLFCKAAIAGAALVTGPSFAAEMKTSDVPKNTKYPANPNNLTTIDELGHVPSIVLEKVDAATVVYGNTPAGLFYKVTVQAKHESILDHHISSIALYINGRQAVVQTINEEVPEFALPMMTALLRLNYGDELLAITECTRHGLWGHKVKV